MISTRSTPLLFCFMCLAIRSKLRQFCTPHIPYNHPPLELYNPNDTCFYAQHTHTQKHGSEDNSSLVKPSSTNYIQEFGKNIPLTIFDQAASYLIINVLLVFSPPTPTNHALKAALAKLLPRFPLFTGRLSTDEHNDPCVFLDSDACVLVSEALVTGSLIDLLPIEPTPELTKLHPPVPGLDRIMSIQLNRFECGGLVIAVSSNHRVSDGQSMSNFFVSWGQVLRCQEVSPVPIHDRGLLVPRNPPLCEFEHQVMEFAGDGDRVPKVIAEESIVNLVVHYNVDFVQRLKERVSLVAGNRSTFQCLTAHVWRKVAVARGLGQSERTSVRIAVNGRSRLKLPNEFFGNLVLWAYPVATVKDLLQQDAAAGLALAAGAIHEAVAEIDQKYFQSVIDFGELSKGERLWLPAQDMDGNFISPNLEVDSWLSFDFHRIDIGGGSTLVAFVPSWIPVEGVVVLIPSTSKERRGVDVYVTLLARHAETFRRIAHSLS